MASKTTNKTIWTLALIAAFGYVIYKFGPALLKKLEGGSSGGSSGGVGSSSPYPYEPDYGQQPQGSSPIGSLNFGGGQGGGGGGSNLGVASAFTNWLQQVLSGGLDNAALIDSELGYSPSTGTDLLGQLDQNGLPLEPTQNFDVNELATSVEGTSAYDPSAYTSVYSGGDTGGYISSAGSSAGDFGGGEGGGGEDY